MRIGSLLCLATAAVSVLAKKRKYDNYNPSAAQIAIDAQTAQTAHTTSNVAGKVFNRFVVIWLENTNFDKAAENSDMEWLAAQGITLDNYWAITHPSEPNYMAAVGGDYFALDDDRFISLPSNVSTIVDLLDTKGISWAEYQEHLPYTGYNGFEYKNQQTFGNDYVRKHNPLALFESVNKNEERLQNIKNFTVFQEDLENEKLPQWSFITPNMTNDGHDSNINVASSWSRDFLTPLLNNEYFMKDTLILLTFDENENYRLKNRVYAVLLGGVIPENKKGTIDHTFYEHYSEISSVEANWDLPNLGRNDVDANVFDIVASAVGIKNDEVDTTYKVNNQTYIGYLKDDTIDLPAPNVNAVGKNGRGVLDSISSVWADKYSSQLSESYFTSTTTTAVWSIGDATTTAASTSSASSSALSSNSYSSDSSYLSSPVSSSASVSSSIVFSSDLSLASSTGELSSSFPSSVEHSSIELSSSTLSVTMSSHNIIPSASTQTSDLTSSSSSVVGTSGYFNHTSSILSSASSDSSIFSSSLLETSSAIESTVLISSSSIDSSVPSVSTFSSASTVTASSSSSISSTSSTAYSSASSQSSSGSTATPTGLDIITNIELTDVRTRSSKAYLYDWFNVAVTFVSQGSISSNSIVQFTIPKEFVGPKPLTLRTPSGHLDVASTNFDEESGLYTIEFNSWGSSKRNIRGTFEFTVRLSNSASSSIQLGSKSFDFRTVSKTFTNTLNFSKIDRTQPWKQGIFNGFNPIWQIEIPGSLGPWSFVDISSILQSLSDYYYDLSSIVFEIGSEFDQFGNITTKRSSNSQDYSTSGSSSGLSLSYTGSINVDEVLRITVPGVKQNDVTSFSNSFGVSINNGQSKRAVEDYSLDETLDTESVAVTDVVTSDDDPAAPSDALSSGVTTHSSTNVPSSVISASAVSSSASLATSSTLIGVSSGLGSNPSDTGVFASTALISNGQTTIVTITSCSEHVCTQTTANAIATVVTSTINNEITSYTTYCPLSTFTTESNGINVVVTSTVTDNLKPSSAAETTSKAPSSTVVGVPSTKSQVASPSSTAGKGSTTTPQTTIRSSVSTKESTSVVSNGSSSTGVKLNSNAETTTTVFTGVTVVKSGSTSVSSSPIATSVIATSGTSGINSSAAKPSGSSVVEISTYAASAVKVQVGQFAALVFGLFMLF